MNLINEIYALSTSDLIAACKFTNPMMNSFLRLAKKNPVAVYNHLTQFKLNHTKHDHYITLVIFDWLIYLHIYWDLLIKDLTGQRKDKFRALTIIEYSLGLSVSKEYIPFYSQLEPEFEISALDHILNIIKTDGIYDGNMQHTKITLMSLNIAFAIVRNNQLTSHMGLLLTALEPYSTNNYSLIFLHASKKMEYDQQILELICHCFTRKLSITEFVNELVDVSDFYSVFKMCALIANANMEEIEFSFAVQGITMIVFALRILNNLTDQIAVCIVSHLVVFIVKKRKVLEDWIVDMILENNNPGIILMWVAVDFPIVFQKISKMDNTIVVGEIVKQMVLEENSSLVDKLAFQLLFYSDKVDLLPVFQIANPDILDLLLTTDSIQVGAIIVTLLTQKENLLYFFHILNSISNENQSFDDSFEDVQSNDCKELTLIAAFAKQYGKTLPVYLIVEILDYSYQNAQSLHVLKGICSLLSYVTWNHWKAILPTVESALRLQESRIAIGIDIKRLLFKKLHYLFVLQIMSFEYYDLAAQENCISNILELLYERVADPNEFLQVINECYNVIGRLPINCLKEIIGKERVEPQTLILQVIANRPQFLDIVDIKKILGIIKHEYNENMDDSSYSQA
ncbi:hypothetical protein HDV06_004415 [Boothiomyces sp. JEL0866]|nr:hypothetical protein HDV06_004415 [Boothiomyces sp. JEL0866]